MVLVLVFLRIENRKAYFNRELGLTPYCLVKQRVKYLLSLKPTSKAISETFIIFVSRFFSSSALAIFRR